MIEVHEYDEQGNRASLTNALGGLTAFSYGAFDQIDLTVAPSGARVALAYNAFGENTAYLDPSDNLVSINYSLLGRETGSSYTWTDPNDPAVTATVSHQTDYDSRGRAVRSVTPFGTTTATNQDDYRYDANDRLVELIGGDGTRTTYTYDDNGALLEITTDGSVSETYAYDLLGRIATKSSFSVGETGESVEIRVSLRYGIESEKVGQTIESLVDGVLQSSDVRSYLITHFNPMDIAQPLEVTDGTNRVTTFVYGHTPLAEISHNGEVKFSLPDGIGTTRSLADSNSEILERYTFDAPGITTRRFNQQDAFSGNPLQPLSLHRYNFAHQNPVTNRDPAGLGIASALLGMAMHQAISWTAGGCCRCRRTGINMMPQRTR